MPVNKIIQRENYCASNGKLSSNSRSGSLRNENVSSVDGILPIDFETFVSDNKTVILNDTLREILLYPQDDVSCVVLPRRWRTVNTTVPDARTAAACPLLTRQSLLSYASSWNLVHYKYSAYSGSYQHLPRGNVPLPEEDIYEIDSDSDTNGQDFNKLKVESATKEGFLLKGPEIGTDRILLNLASKSFKRKYCSLRKEVDGTYMLDIHKDDKKSEIKHNVVMDFCSEIIKNPKRGKYCFELRMTTGNKGYTFAAESETELNEWFAAFTAAVQKNHSSQDSGQLDSTDKDLCFLVEPPSSIYGTLKGLEHSMNPLLMSYARETDVSIAHARNDARYNLFILPSIQANTPEPQLEPFKEHFGQRILLKCESLRFRLQAPIDGDKELLCQVEPYFTYVSLYDARSGRKLTENFHFDLNHPAVSDLVKENGCLRALNQHFSNDVKIDYKQIPEDWIRSKKQALLSVTNPHPDIFIVVKIDKLLQGNINQVTEPYLRATKDPRLGLKIHKSLRAHAGRIGDYRMPFAWAAKPLFRLYSNELDTCADFPAIYRQEPGRISDEDLLKVLSDYRKPEKLSKLTMIPGWIKVHIEPCAEQPPDSMTSAWAPLKPFPLPPSSPLTLELASPGATPEQPHASYLHHLFVRPQMLSFEAQKVFARARNIACTVELRDSDVHGSAGILAIFGPNGMLQKQTCPVVHHNTTPTWSYEIKIRLPVLLTNAHHLLFTFHHISCDVTKKNENGIETCVGYSWIILLKNGRIVEEIVNLPVATHLPAGYLSIQPLGLGRGNSGPEVIWVEGEKALFRVHLVLDSTVTTRDQHLLNMFSVAEKLLANSPAVTPSDAEVCKALKAAHAVQLATLLAFQPTIFNQLLEILMTVKTSSDVCVNIVRLMVHFVHMIHDNGRKDILDSYIKYVFACIGSGVHEQLSAPLYTFVESSQHDFLLGHKFMQHSEFFFQIMTKSMAQYLINTGRIKMARNERFSGDFSSYIDRFVSTIEPSYILQQPFQTHIINKNLATFLKTCLSFMDRGFVFKQIKQYIDKFKKGDPKALFDFKFTFLEIVCSHEHFISFNMPVQRRPSVKELPNSFAKLRLSQDFIRRHFLVGILLQQVELSLKEAPQKRKLSLSILRALLTKHELDDRYQSKGAKARIAALYGPWLSIVCDNVHRLAAKEISSAGSQTNGNLSKCDLESSGLTPAGILLHKDTVASTCTPKRNRLTLHFDQASPVRNSAYFKDALVINSNMMTVQDSPINNSRTSLESDLSTMSGSGSNINQCSDAMVHRVVKKVDLKDGMDHVNRFGVMSKEEVRDMLLCFLFVLKYIDNTLLIEWWENSPPGQLQAFFTVMEICIDQFQYLGKKKIMSEAKVLTPDHLIKIKPPKARTLPARMSPPDFSKDPPSLPEKTNTVNRENLTSNSMKESDWLLEYAALSAGWLATEIGLTIIDRVCLYSKQCNTLKQAGLVSFAKSTMISDLGSPAAAAKPLHALLDKPQSETLYKHLFAALRSYISQFSIVLFEGNGVVCGNIVSALLRLCDSKMPSLRKESAAMLYLLMRGNFEHTHRKGLIRIHLQVIIAVSQLVGNAMSLHNARFQESLSLINSFASSDKVMKGTGFPSEVKELTRRVRTVLAATAELGVGTRHLGSGDETDGGAERERLAELQYQLAVSCRATPRLRHAWLSTLADHHARGEDIAEAMCCQLHIAALIAEYLKLRSCQSWGAEAFADISMNIPRDETGLKIDDGVVDVHYTEQSLLEQLETCAEWVERGERYELLGPLCRLLLPMLERRGDWQTLAKHYRRLAAAYQTVIDVNRSGRRLLGRFYRVAFFGKVHFLDDDGVEYIYKEPKLTSLSEISERLQKLYEQKFGSGVVKMIMDSAPVKTEELDTRIAYVQVTSVEALVEGGSNSPASCSSSSMALRRAHDIRRFTYDTPFTKSGRARGPVHEQCKRRTVLTTESWFPYITRRIRVVDTQIEEMTPIEVALSEMETQVAELNEIVNAEVHDAKKLQLRLQGSVCVQVNAGPLAYASAFLDPALSSMYPDDLVKRLSNIFKEFLKVCNTALQINNKLISSDQLGYQEALEDNYHKLCDSLSSVMGENMLEVIQNGNSPFTAMVSGADVDSSNA